jgi:hypothetical protein
MLLNESWILILLRCSNDTRRDNACHRRAPVTWDVQSPMLSGRQQTVRVLRPEYLAPLPTEHEQNKGRLILTSIWSLCNASDIALCRMCTCRFCVLEDPITWRLSERTGTIYRSADPYIDMMNDHSQRLKYFLKNNRDSLSEIKG